MSPLQTWACARGAESSELNGVSKEGSYGEVRRSRAAGGQTPPEPEFNVMAAVSSICCYTAVLSPAVSWWEICPTNSGGCLGILFQALILATWEKGMCILDGPVFRKQQHRLVRNCLVTESTVSEKGILETGFICFMEIVVFSCFLCTFLTFIAVVVLWEHLWALSAFSFTIPPKGLRSSILRGVNMEQMEAN